MKCNKEINFRANNGFCPYFIYGNTKFFIQDNRNSLGLYKYTLCSKSLNIEVKCFDDEKLAMQYLKSIKNIRHVYSSSDASLYTDRFRYYVVRNKCIEIKDAALEIAGPFDSYLDCLHFSKKYISDFIAQQKSVQITLF